jgi:Fe-S-cluster containining protein
MKKMEHEELAGRLREIGFSCTRCGVCCRDAAEDANLVMVTPGEIDLLSQGTGQPSECFTEPYPESIRTVAGGSLTFERCLSRTPTGCTFLSGNFCTVYRHRPWICRTYPFMLDGDELVIFPCEGLGRGISGDQARELSLLLLQRRAAETEEEEAVGRVLASVPVPEGKRVLIDGRGLTVI